MINVFTPDGRRKRPLGRRGLSRRKPATGTTSWRGTSRCGLKSPFNLRKRRTEFQGRYGRNVIAAVAAQQLHAILLPRPLTVRVLQMAAMSRHEYALHIWPSPAYVELDNAPRAWVHCPLRRLLNAARANRTTVRGLHRDHLRRPLRRAPANHGAFSLPLTKG